jgi:AraC family transcriptional regulator of arabinose operon
MRIRSISWRKAHDPARSLTIGEFDQGPEYRTVRQSGTPNYLLILTLGGGGRVFSETREQVDTIPGDILLFEPGAYHNYGTSPASGRWDVLWSHFVPPADWDYWNHWPACWPGLRLSKVGPVTAGRVCDALRLVHDTEFTVRETEGAFMLNCLQRAWLFIRQAEERARVPDRDPRIQKALQLMETRYSSVLSIGDIAAHCGLSLSRFAHLFKDEMQRTPQQYLETRRMDQARNLIRFSNLPIGDVARVCGYEDPFYFSTRFKRAFGRSPRAFRG